MTDAPADITTTPKDAPAPTGDPTGEPAKAPETTTNGQPPEPKLPERPAMPESDDAKLDAQAAYFARHIDKFEEVAKRVQQIKPDAFDTADTPPGKTEAEFDAAIQNVRLEAKMDIAFRDAAIKYPDISVEDVKMMRADNPEQVDANAKYLSERFAYEVAKAKGTGDAPDGDDPKKPGHLTKDPPDKSGRLGKEISVDNKGGITLPAPTDNPASDLEQAEASFDAALNEVDMNDLMRTE